MRILELIEKHDLSSTDNVDGQFIFKLKRFKFDLSGNMKKDNEVLLTEEELINEFIPVKKIS